ncbi:hypothetical protein HD806DRAFT_545111 [Xylariaceae sp. AK1471]|nr:hypothetical protein HD806DRAFT_545111 [Xylariaceae sp. AK1471]
MPKHVICERCCHVLKPGGPGATTKDVERLPAEECPRCSLDDQYIDWEQKWHKEGEQEYFHHWLINRCPSMEAALQAADVEPSPEETEQMRRHRLYQDSIDNYKHLISEHKADRIIMASTSVQDERRQQALRGVIFNRPGIHQDLAIAKSQNRTEALEKDVLERNADKGIDEPREPLPYSYKSPMVKPPEWHAAQHAARVARVNANANFTAEELRGREPSAGLRNPNIIVPGQTPRWNGKIPMPEWKDAPARTQPWPMSVASFNRIYNKLPVNRSRGGYHRDDAFEFSDPEEAEQHKAKLATRREKYRKRQEAEGKTMRQSKYNKRTANDDHPDAAARSSGPSQTVGYPHLPNTNKELDFTNPARYLMAPPPLPGTAQPLGGLQVNPIQPHNNPSGANPINAQPSATFTQLNPSVNPHLIPNLLNPDFGQLTPLPAYPPIRPPSPQVTRTTFGQGVNGRSVAPPVSPYALANPGDGNARQMRHPMLDPHRPLASDHHGVRGLVDDGIRIYGDYRTPSVAPAPAPAPLLLSPPAPPAPPTPANITRTTFGGNGGGGSGGGDVGGLGNNITRTTFSRG